MNEQLFGCCTLDQYLANGCPDTGTVSMSGFVDNYGRQPLSDGVGPNPPNIMQYYAPGPDGCVPVTSALAQAYGVSDQWHAAGPVQTLANRFFVHCATPSTYVENNQTFALKNNTELTKRHRDPDGSVSAKSVYELLDEAAGQSGWPWPGRTPWKVYFGDWPLAALVKYVDDNWGPLGGRVHLIDDPLTGFFHDLRRNKLPTYSFLEPHYTNLLGTASSNHPGGADISGNGPPISICQGEKLLSKVYQALYNAPKNLFERTLLIVTYDEHGGCYDHVPPPAAVSPFPAELGVQGFNFDRYGVRVPNIFINPFIQPETIFRPPSAAVPFDNTSIISTLCKQFGLAGPLTPRDAQAPTLAGLINPANPTNPYSPADLPTFTCPKSKSPKPAAGATVAPRTEPRADTVAAVIKQAMSSPKNQGRVMRLGLPKF
jgi:phospholipase C